MASTSKNSDEEQVKGDIERLREDIRSLRDDVGSMARNSASRMRGSIEDNARHYQEKAEEFVTEKPLATIAIAAGIGAALGLIASRCGSR